MASVFVPEPGFKPDKFVGKFSLGIPCGSVLLRLSEGSGDPGGAVGRGAQHEAAPVSLPLYGTVGVWCVVLPAWSGAARSLLRRVRFDSQWPRLVTQGQVRRPWSSL